MQSMNMIIIVIVLILVGNTTSFSPKSSNSVSSSNRISKNIDFNVDKKDLLDLSYYNRKYKSNSRRKYKYQVVSNSIIETSTAAADGFTYAFVGGTVGVMFTMFALEWKKTKDKTLEGCPYCMGNGEILCASCNGAAFGLKTGCSCCNGRGLILCINCKGDGRLTPIILQSRNVRDPEFGASDNLSPDAP
jgi:hypothetical protein